MRDVINSVSRQLAVWRTDCYEELRTGTLRSCPGDVFAERKFYFKKADAIPGPDDPEVFADELNIELYDPDSGHAWWQSYFVATPQGLARLLREKSWRYLHAPDILVFPRYNLEEIRRAVVSRIIADHEYFKGKEQGEEESL